MKKEEKAMVDDYCAEFFYDSGIPFNVVRNLSFEVFVEVVGRFGQHYRFPTIYNLRVNLLNKQVTNIYEMRKLHEEQWKLGGCTLMSNSWTDCQQRSVINFLVNSHVRTFYLHSIDASTEEKTAQYITDGLDDAIQIIGPETVVQVDVH